MQMFDRFTAEIVEDLPTVYELPQEAVDWVAEMIPYTVAGGKMNRGLAVLDVQRTFAKHNGQQVTNKVSGYCIVLPNFLFLIVNLTPISPLSPSVVSRAVRCSGVVHRISSGFLPGG